MFYKVIFYSGKFFETRCRMGGFATESVVQLVEKKRVKLATCVIVLMYGLIKRQKCEVRKDT